MQTSQVFTQWVTYGKYKYQRHMVMPVKAFVPLGTFMLPVVTIQSLSSNVR